MRDFNSSNIAEGAAKNVKKNFARLVQIGLRSCFGLESHLILCADLNLVDTKETVQNLANTQPLQLKMHSLINYVSTQPKG